ncbi:MAG: hypothetical protein JJW00_07755 [Sulfurimonas sp.]|nr:hypothetical protein [Sulfurimonas sp.]
MALIVLVDGAMSAEEELLLLEAEAIFGIKGSMYHNTKLFTLYKGFKKLQNISKIELFIK